MDAEDRGTYGENVFFSKERSTLLQREDYKIFEKWWV